VRSDRSEVGLSARTHKRGALLERWRAQCGNCINYTADPGIRAGATKEIVLIAALDRRVPQADRRLW